MVDDNVEAAEHLRHILISSGYEVPEIVTHGAEATKAAERLSPELMIINADMDGDPDGVQTAITIGSRYSIPVVFLSGGGIDSERAVSATPYGYMHRNSDPDTVRVVVAFALNKYRREQGAKEHEKTLNKLLDIPSVGIVLIDRTYAVRSINQEAARRINRSADDLIGTSIEDLIGRDPFSEDLLEALKESFSGKSVTMNVEIGEHWIEEILCPIRDPIGNITGVALYIYNFSDLRRKYQELLDALPFGIVIVNHNKVIRFVNREALNLMKRLSPAELSGKICYEALCPADKDACPIFDRHQTLDRSERILVDRFGNHIPILKSVSEFKFFDQPLLLESFIDYSDYKMAERSIRESEEKYKILAESSDDIILMTSTHGEIRYMNSAGLDYFGNTQCSVIGCNLKSFFSGDLTEHLMEGIHQVQEQGTTDFLIRTSEGEESRWFNVHIRPVPLGSDAELLLAVARDMTMYQESVISLEKNMEKLAILNDEIRNPLQMILGTVLLKDPDLAEKIQPFLSEIDELVDRLDQGWLESKKVHEMLKKHYGLFEDGQDGR
ncbi:PAS domain-containing protein [Methanofollis fontis]|uniref:PAS domain-containing protein n=1 Tax=Methanofollis fontis TaxID=2052832 RepID=UPI003743BCC5